VAHIREVWRGEALALEDGKPLLDLVHPGAVDRGEVHLEARVLLEPSSGELALVRADVVADEVDDGDTDGGSPVDFLKQFDELRLTLASPADPDHLARSQVEGGDEVRGPAALVLVFDLCGTLGAWRLGWNCSGSRLHRRFLVEREHALMGKERSCVQVLDVEYGSFERRVQGRVGAEPVVDSPGFELVREQDPLDRLGRDGLDDAISHQSTRQLSAGPEGQRPVRIVRELTGQLDEVSCGFGGKSGVDAHSARHPPDP